MRHSKSVARLATLALPAVAMIYVACGGGSTGNDDSSGGDGGTASTGGAMSEGGSSAGGSASKGGASANSGGNTQPGGSGAGGSGPQSNGGATNGGAGGATSNGGAGGATGGMAGASAGGVAGMAAAGADGFGLGGGSRCATSGALLCEDFENGLASATWAKTTAGDGTAVVDELHAARGKKALHVHTSNGSGRAWIRQTKTFPITNNVVFGRMYVWFEDPIATDGHFSLAEGAGTGTGALIRFGGQNQVFGVGSDGGPSGDWTDKDKTIIPSKKWLCMEFQFKSDTNEFRVWWDDKELTRLRSGPAKHPNFTMPQFTSLWFGWWMYNKQEPQDLWIDEIAVNSQPIGCAK